MAKSDVGPIRKINISARASSSWLPNTPHGAFDGGRNTMWNSGGYAPQWIEADLGAPAQLDSILLVATQLPAGETTHEIWVSSEPIGENRAKAKLIRTLTGITDAGQQLKIDFPKELYARYVQIRTTQSPSWVSWERVELRVGRARFEIGR
ncbi:MAG: discoidin domain-containing protein [Gemmataceae bacterium]|nr:discoidin domain-containing protein [Gemmataceae bacterium]